MKKLILFVLVFGMTPVAIGEVSTRVCLADGNTPFLPVEPNSHVYPDIMVGTRLTIIVDSNVAEEWSGDLAVADANMNYGVLLARGPLIGADWSGSHLEAAGVEASVCTWQQGGGGEPDIDGFTLYTGYIGIEAGDWFIIDYNALEIGDCNVGFYDHNSISYEVPIYYLSFSHVRTRDFNGDTVVNFVDFAVLASYWREADCNDPNWCEGVDLDTDSDIDFYDFALFAEYWRETTR